MGSFSRTKPPFRNTQHPFLAMAVPTVLYSCPLLVTTVTVAFMVDVKGVDVPFTCNHAAIAVKGHFQNNKWKFLFCRIHLPFSNYWRFMLETPEYKWCEGLCCSVCMLPIVRRKGNKEERKVSGLITPKSLRGVVNLLGKFHAVN
jgi:hypothetical protein